MNGKLHQVEQHLEDLKRVVHKSEIPPAERPNLLALIMSIEGEIALSRGEVATAIALFDHSLDHLLEDEMPIRDVTMLKLAQAYRLQGDIKAAGRVMAQLSNSKATVNNRFKLFIQIINQAEHYIFHGQLQQALLICQQFFQSSLEATLQPPPPIIAGVHLKLGELFYEQNQLDLALEHINQGFEIEQPFLGVHYQLAGYVSLAKIYQAQSDKDRALAVLNQAIARNQEINSLPEYDQAKAMMARLWLTQDNLAAAEAWAKEQSLDIDDEFSYLREFEYITLARLLFAHRQFEAACQLLGRLLQKAEETDRLQSMIEILILQSLIHQAQNDGDQAIATIKRALMLAEPEGYIRLFVDEGGPMAALLLRSFEAFQQQSEQASFATVDFLRKLLDILGVATAAPAKEKWQPLVEPLTKRELEILQLVTAGLSNRQIAERLIISENTVKTHAHNIFGKLNVGSRVQAIVKAKELDLL